MTFTVNFTKTLSELNPKQLLSFLLSHVKSREVKWKLHNRKEETLCMFLLSRNAEESNELLLRAAPFKGCYENRKGSLALKIVAIKGCTC